LSLLQLARDGLCLTRALRGQNLQQSAIFEPIRRVALYLLLSLSTLLAPALVALGIPQTLASSVGATSFAGPKQLISVGPVASQEAIKEPGTNGGGFNANTARPYENPNAISNLPSGTWHQQRAG
jgi:K+-transporting ATPase A subunit